MAHRTAPAVATTDTAEPPPDIATMRETARILLTEGAPPDADLLETLTLQVRGHLELLMPDVQAIADRMPEDDIPRYCALACIGEARGKLRLEARPGLAAGLAHARRLARVLNALCDHHEGLAAT